MTRRPRNRGGFALVEVLVAVLFMGVFMLALLQVRNQTLHQFLRSGDQHTGAWLAELKMAELISQNLPDPEDEESWQIFESGDFAEFDDRLNEINANVNEGWTDRAAFSKFEWECTKELVFVGPSFIGSREDLDLWEQPLDENGEPTTDKDPREQAAARVVRVTLTVYLPEPKLSGLEDEQAPQGRPVIKLVTYVDPSILFEAEPAADDPTAQPGN
ncbi:MAG: hypothetical protein H6841_00640 [Planctomycetes bacterium]|nr:hypothetical protein [Planctomycetota bacterium]